MLEYMSRVLLHLLAFTAVALFAYWWLGAVEERVAGASGGRTATNGIADRPVGRRGNTKRRSTYQYSARPMDPVNGF